MISNVITNDKNSMPKKAVGEANAQGNAQHQQRRSGGKFLDINEYVPVYEFYYLRYLTLNFFAVVGVSVAHQQRIQKIKIILVFIS
jgi:hypothetical protein